MTPAELLAEVTAAGLRVDLTDDGSLYVQPRERITPDLIERLKAAKPELVSHLRRERLIELAAEQLRQHPERQRAAQMEPDGPGRYLVAVAVRMKPDGIAAGILTVATGDGFALLAGFDAACRGPLQ